MYTNKDIDDFLIAARKDKESVLLRIGEVAAGQDANVIGRAINDPDFFAEDFDRYDSDVCERFLILMELTGIAK